MVTLQNKTLTTHPQKVTLVTLDHMGGPTHPQVTKVTLFHVKRSLSFVLVPHPYAGCNQPDTQHSCSAGSLEGLLNASDDEYDAIL